MPDILNMAILLLIGTHIFMHMSILVRHPCDLHQRYEYAMAHLQGKPDLLFTRRNMEFVPETDLQAWLESAAHCSLHLAVISMGWVIFFQGSFCRYLPNKAITWWLRGFFKI